MATLNPFQIYENFSDAQRIQDYLPKFQLQIKGIIEGEEEKARSALMKLGQVKYDCYNRENGTYHALLKAVQELWDKKGKSLQRKNKEIKLSSLQPSQRCIEVSDATSEIMAAIAKGGAAGATAGILAAYGAFSLAGLVGTASTGTAISVLSGSAALKATLAWLGGGALSAGGFGITGGMIMLGGILAVPVALISAVSLGAKSETLLADARSKLEEAKAEESKARLAAEKLREIGKTAQLARKTLQRLSNMAQILIPDIVAMKDLDDEDEEAEANKCYMASSILDLIDGFAAIDVLDDEGKLCLETKAKCQECNSQIDTLEENHGKL